MPSPAGPAELLADLAAGLATIGARWYVFGAQAALVWGRPRLTTDVDVTVKCTVSTDQLILALDRSGFSLRIDGTEAFIRTTRVVPLEHRASGLALDVVVASTTKLLAGREKDIDDVRGVLSERGSALDVTRIRTTLALLEDALGQSDLMPVFDREFGHWQRTRQHGDG